MQVYKITIFLSGFASQGVLDKDPTVCLDGAWIPPKYFWNYIKNSIVSKKNIIDMSFGDKTVRCRLTDSQTDRQSVPQTDRHA